MKTITFKSLPAVLLAVLCMGIISCENKSKKDEPTPGQPVVQPEITEVGLWEMYALKDGEKVSMASCIRLNEDGSAEYYTKQQGFFLYYKGVYAIKDSAICTEWRENRQFVLQSNIIHFVSDIKGNTAYWIRDTFDIVSMSETEHEINYWGAPLYFVKTTSLPDYWEDEFSEPEITLSEQNLLAKWDCNSTFKRESHQFSTYSNPEEYGFVLGENGELYNCPFWIDFIFYKEVQSGHLMSNDHIYVYYRDCSWTLSGNRLSMKCKAYTKVEYDASGNISSETPVTPASPVTVNFTVVTLTDHWLIIYSALTELYYVCHKSSAAPSSAPRKVGAGNTLK